MPPLSAKALLLSIYHGRYGEVNNVVQPKKRATRTEYIQATMFVLWTAKVEFDDFQNVRNWYMCATQGCRHGEQYICCSNSCLELCAIDYDTAGSLTEVGLGYVSLYSG